MFTRKLGRSGIEISAMGLGCWAIGGPFWDQGGWMGYGAVDDAESIRALRRALDLGITFFDVSDVYGCGHAERVMAEAFGSRTREVVIAAKFGYTFDEEKRAVTGRDVSPTAIRKACEGSLRRLQREYLDLYQLHLHDLSLDEALTVRNTLDELVSEGKIRWYSWCTEDPERISAFAAGSRSIAAPQLVNVLEHNASLLKVAEDLNLAAIARRPLGMGLLTGKFTSATSFPETDMRTRFKWNLRDGKQAGMLARLERLKELLTADGRTLAQGCIGWVWARSPVTIPIPGFKTVAQVEENVRSLRLGPLEAEHMPEIASCS
ncbi:MAG: aldo/keto reductase [Blastocatellia bacterium]|nr:aldo/keto reductase [Blastocatellia bacterium]